ncbi:UDP-N-acetylmuramoyl-tripeptide--D-alanyl-D-alanine ligase [Candidatus Providencia siddallii]|uniref:UDP-N-acetylmuramoyl-tripeptide--D-alanyl-D-alanine ligase n=1 Tax=Candidatus Providencia siddallii TaxID=1715285 RepID=A0ABM9NP25_9GAMM
MIPITLSQLARITKGYIKQKIKKKITIQSISIDSNNITKDCLFIALIGKRFNAHNFIDQVIANGAKLLLVEQELDVNCAQIIVKNTRIAMGQIASWIRQNCKICVIGLTGSSGKTTVKEMLGSILSEYGNTLYTSGNFNNDIGVPLTLFKLTPKHNFAIIEIGASKPNEIKYLTKIIKPNISLVNNLFNAHIEGFQSIKNIKKEKGEIYKITNKTGSVIVNLDSYSKKWKFHPKQTILYFSLNKKQKTNFYASNIQFEKLTTNFILHTPIGDTNIFLQLIGKHNISNALAASALAIAAGATLDHIKQGLKKIKPILGRLYPIYIDKSKILLDDSYNSNNGSMFAAINVLISMPGYKVLVISDTAELGKFSYKYHKNIALIIKNSEINKILSIGKFSTIIKTFNKNTEHFNFKKKILIRLLELIEQNKTISILIKGSRSFHMEEIVNKLKEFFKC